MTDTELYRTAIARWGAESQLLMVCEECAELSVAIHHYLRGRGTTDAIAEEVADVEFMLDQVKALFDLSGPFPERVSEFRAQKRERLCRILSSPAPTGKGNG